MLPLSQAVDRLEALGKTLVMDKDKDSWALGRNQAAVSSASIVSSTDTSSGAARWASNAMPTSSKTNVDEGKETLLAYMHKAALGEAGSR